MTTAEARVKFRAFDAREVLETEAAALIGGTARRRERDPFGLMLTGGRTPLGVYERLAAEGRSAAPNLVVLISDERHVSAGSAEHNFSRLRGALDALSIDEDRRLSVNTSLPLDEAAADYDRQLTGFLERGTIRLGLLGLGADGHLASLFTDDDLRRRDNPWAVAVRRPEGPHRVSVTVALLHRVERLVFLVAGGGKAEALDRLAHAPDSVPAGRALAGHEHVEVWHWP